MSAHAARYPAPPPPAPERFTERPVVIGGCARSGTTLLISILSCHPAIYAIPDETQLLCVGTFDRPPRPRPPNLRALYALLDRADVPEGARRWCEKTPRNVLCFQQIRDALPDALLINLVRDGRDVCTSRHPGNPTNYWVPPGRWMRETKAGLAVDGVLTMRYEDLVLDYEATMRDLLAWIGEPWDDALLDYPANATITESRAWGGDALPLYEDGAGRWRLNVHAERVAEFYAQEGTVAMLERLGYAL